MIRDIEIEYQGGREVGRGLCRADLQDDFAANIVLTGLCGIPCPRINRETCPWRRLLFGYVVHRQHHSVDA